MPRDENRYILITECLQNDLFLNRECGLYLHDKTVLPMLVGKRARRFARPESSRLELPADAVAAGPLGVFLEAAIGRRRRGEDGRGTLHVVNVRDWHVPDEAYDTERRAYGAHCERGTWGARYLDGLAHQLDPLGAGDDEEACYFEEGSVRIYHVHADSVFDFKPRLDSRVPGERKFRTTEVEDVIDVLVQGSDVDVEQMRELLREDGRLAAIHDLAHEVGRRETVETDALVYTAVLGVYSDVKIVTLVGGLRTRYDTNLAISDSLSASQTLERHLSALDFAQKVMRVEIIHGVNDLVRYLGGSPPLENESELVSADNFSRYQSFFKDKQNLLSYQNEQLQNYLELTEQRAIDNFTWIKRSNLFLIAWGSAFLVVTLVMSVWAALEPDRIEWWVPTLTGGLSLLQLVSAFYSKPMRDLQQNLTNLAIFKMILESHSLKTAFTRFHLTTPHTLREVRTEDESRQAMRQIEVLERELGLIEKFDEVDFKALRDLGFRVDEAGPETNGAAPVPAPAEQPAAER